MTKAVIFDMDGVLIDSEMEYLKIRYRFAVKKNPALRLEELFDMVGHTDGEAWSVVEKAIGNGQSWKELLAVASSNSRSVVEHVLRVNQIVGLIDNRFRFDRSLADYEIDRIEDLLEVELFRELYK